MTPSRLPLSWLRTLAGLVALAGALVLSGCGGGSGAPNNEFKPYLLLNSAGGTLFDVYPGFPTTMVVSGGLAPFRAVSSNPAVLPVVEQNQNSPIVLAANNVSADTPVQVTVQDSMGRVVAATVLVHPAPMINTLTITPTGAECGATAVCSGQTGTAVVTIVGPGGGPVAGRQVRFDVVQGPFGIVSGAPGSPAVSTLTVASDAAGHATVVLLANAGAPTQYALIRATDLATGQQLTGAFLIQQVIDGSKVLSVVPDKATITAAFKGECSFGFAIDYFVYGGTPPYRVSSTFPNAITLVNQTVPESGLAFRAITNGTCVDPLTFTIVDAAGLQTTATLINKEGSGDPPTPPVPPVSATISPSTYTACGGKSFNVFITGGTAPYSVSPAGSPPTTPTITPQPLTAAGSVVVTGLVSPVSGSNVYNFNVADGGSPATTTTFRITCNP